LPGVPEIGVSEALDYLAAGRTVEFVADMSHPSIKTFVIANEGNAILSFALTQAQMPNGYTLIPPALTELGPGESTTFGVRLDAVVPGSYAGTISIVTNDSDEAPFSFHVAGTVLPTQIMDDGDQGYSQSGGFQSALLSLARGGDNSYAFHQAAPSEASWTFAVTPGQYLIAATWFNTGGNQIFASNARFTVLDGETPIGTVFVNQRFGPNDFTDAGSSWDFLGGPTNVVSVFGSTLTVRLTNMGANGYVLADAIRLERIGPVNGSDATTVSIEAGSRRGGQSVLPTSDPRPGPDQQNALLIDAVDQAMLAIVYWKDTAGERDVSSEEPTQAAAETATDLATESDRAEEIALEIVLAEWLEWICGMADALP
jgi:hypothetical protein